MRIRTDGKFAYREALVDDVTEQLGENTRVGTVEASCEFTQAMLSALAKAVESVGSSVSTTRTVDADLRASASRSAFGLARFWHCSRFLGRRGEVAPSPQTLLTIDGRP